MYPSNDKFRSCSGELYTNNTRKAKLFSVYKNMNRYSTDPCPFCHSEGACDRRIFPESYKKILRCAQNDMRGGIVG